MSLPPYKVTDSLKPQTPPEATEETTDESDTEESESVAWDDVKEGDEEALEDRLLPEAKQVKKSDSRIVERNRVRPLQKIGVSMNECDWRKLCQPAIRHHGGTTDTALSPSLGRHQLYLSSNTLLD
jgi:hypothetical protein